MFIYLFILFIYLFIFFFGIQTYILLINLFSCQYLKSISQQTGITGEGKNRCVGGSKGEGKEKDEVRGEGRGEGKGSEGKWGLRNTCKWIIFSSSLNLVR